VIVFDRSLMAEFDTGHVTFVFRWRCCACGVDGDWLIHEQTSTDLGVEHATNHFQKEPTQ
jgi:hypothetical protein